MLDKNSFEMSQDSIDIVIHLATSHIGGNEQLNLQGSNNIIEFCKEKKIKRIIYISSMAVKRDILDEYGAIKLQIEELIKQSGLDYTILRPSMIYSNKNLGIITKTFNFPFIIPIIGNGHYRINPVYIDDLIKAIEKSIESKVPIKKEYDIAGGESMSFNELVKISMIRFKMKKLIIHIPLKLCILIFKIVPIVSVEAIKGINQDTNADISSLKKDLKIIPISFREGVKNVNI
jgi:nucleoside-diphosphate-sugar epimerase